MSVDTCKMAVITITAIILTFAFISDAKCEDFYFLTAVSGDSLGDRFYYVAKGRGDVNGDGFEDVLIGASGDYAKLFFGSAAFDTIPDLVLHGEPHPMPSAFGICAFAGDVNSDGFDDILIGDPEYCPYGFHTGRAYLYFGGLDMDTIPDLIFDGECFSDVMGSNVSGAGDVNGDGYDDWLISSPMYFQPESEIYLYYGSEYPDAVCDVCFEGDPENSLQFDAPALGDVNGDGFDDLLFCTLNPANPPLFQKLYLGSSTMDTIPELVWNGGYDYAPTSGVGDVNGDGYNDWVLNTFLVDGIELFFGSQHPDTIPDMVFTPEAPSTSFGYVSRARGDIDGDGVDDLLINGRSDSGLHTGQIFGYLGGAMLDIHYDYFFDSGVQNLNLGTILGMADINGDSICEVLAGATQYQSQGNNWGPGQVWFLSTQLIPGVPQVGESLYPSEFKLYPPFPNPFNPTTAFSFQLPARSFVELTVYDIQGRLVAELVNGWRNAGVHEVTFDASDLASGIYLCRLETGDFIATGKTVLMK